MNTPPRKPRRRGFAAMSPEMRRLLSSKGGSAVPAAKRTFSVDRAAAAEAGRKGGSSPRRKPDVE